MGRDSRSIAVWAVAAALAAILFQLHPAEAAAQEPNQVTGLAAVQSDGFATLSWDPVAGATDYQIERTPVNDANEPTGPAVIVGVWQPTRTIRPEEPTFAESGFVLGQRYGWRVQARLGSTNPQPFSEPVFATTKPQWGDPGQPGESLRTQWELTGGEEYTTDVNEWAYTAAVDAASDRVRVLEIGRTVLGRQMNMLVFGYPTPLPTAQQISSSPTVLIQCNVHGNEPSMRESCLILARELAFTDDPELLDIMSRATILMIPTINGDGRAADTRGNSTGQDLNRDHSLLRQPETRAFAAVLRDYTPDLGIDGHNGDSEDLPILSSRHLNVFEGLFTTAKTGLVEGWLYDHAADSGWYAGPYSNGGASQETILRNTFGLKNIVGLLSENRASAGSTRPGATFSENQRRRSYGQLWLIRRVLEYHRANLPAIQEQIAQSVAFQTSNVGRVVFRGSYPWPLFPPLPSAPDVDAPDPEDILEEAPCGYLLTGEQYSGANPDGTVELRLDLHGIVVQDRPAGHVVRMAQPLRGLIPPLLDDQAAEEMVDGQRLSECPHAAVSPGSLAAAAEEDTETTDSLTIANEAVEPDEPLEWTITEAASDCSSPSNLGWVSAGVTAGTTPSGSSTPVTITFSADGLTAPDVHTGVLCISSNDAGAPVIAVPVSLQVQYPFDGFLATFENPPVLNPANSRSVQKLWFRLGGDRGLDILAAGSPASRRIDCTTKAPLGPLEPTATPPWAGLFYQRYTDRYQYPWRPPKGGEWVGTCREFVLTLDDASVHTAWFHFIK